MANLNITSMSFNPTNWICSACPKKHPILGGGLVGAGVTWGEGGGRLVIVLADQNFPGVLPTATGNCVAIVGIEHGSMKELADLLISIVPDSLPFGTIILIGSLTQLQGEGLQGYANSGIRITRKLEGTFSGSTSVVFIPPPLGGCGNPMLVRAIVDGCKWLSKMPGYPMQKTMKTISDEILRISMVGGGGGSSLSIMTSQSSFPTPSTPTMASTLRARAEVTFRHASPLGPPPLRKKSLTQHWKI